MTLVGQSVTGEAVLQARLVSQAPVGGDAGITFRDGTSPTAAFASVAGDGDGRIFFRWRTADGGNARYAVAYSSAPVWLRLLRSGNAFTTSPLRTTPYARASMTRFHRPGTPS